MAHPTSDRHTIEWVQSAPKIFIFKNHMSSPHPPVVRRESRDTIDLSHGHPHGQATDWTGNTKCQLACFSNITDQCMLLAFAQSRNTSLFPGMGVYERETPSDGQDRADQAYHFCVA
jgi:hypothetical protein